MKKQIPKNKRHFLGYLGYLGFLGFIAFPTENFGFLGFFGFFSYFSAFLNRDEMLDKIVGEATKHSFAYLVIAGIATLVYVAFSQNTDFLKIGYIILFSGSIAVCIISYLIQVNLLKQKK